MASRFCIDRYEATMVDDTSGQEFSPFYPPDLVEMRKAVIGQPWGLAVLGKAQMRPPVPLLPEWQRSPNARARAVSRSGVVPQGYLSKPTAKARVSGGGQTSVQARRMEDSLPWRAEHSLPLRQEIRGASLQRSRATASRCHPLRRRVARSLGSTSQSASGRRRSALETHRSYHHMPQHVGR